MVTYKDIASFVFYCLNRSIRIEFYGRSSKPLGAGPEGFFGLLELVINIVIFL
jgi:hypothetical protein